MDFALAQLALIFLPGVIWANIDAKYGAGLRPSETTLFIRAFIFGTTTYAVLFLIYAVAGREFGYLALASGLSGSALFSLKDEIAWAIPTSFVLSVIWLWIVRFRLVMRFLNWIGATKRFGDEDVWSFTFNSNKPNVEYVHVRDIEGGYIYAGWVNAYSENEDYRELLLSDAIVYTENAEEVSQAPLLYLARTKTNVWIEFPFNKEDQRNVTN